MSPFNDILKPRSIYEQPYKKQALTAAKELGYDERFIERIKKAKTEVEIERIMVTARKEKFG